PWLTLARSGGRKKVESLGHRHALELAAAAQSMKHAFAFRVSVGGVEGDRAERRVESQRRLASRLGLGFQRREQLAADPEPSVPGVDVDRSNLAAIRGLNSQFYTPEQIAAWSSDKQPERYVQALADGEFMVVAESPEGVTVGFGSSKGDGSSR